MNNKTNGMGAQRKMGKGTKVFLSIFFGFLAVYFLAGANPSEYKTQTKRSTFINKILSDGQSHDRSVATLIPLGFQKTSMATVYINPNIFWYKANIDQKKMFAHTAAAIVTYERQSQCFRCVIKSYNTGKVLAEYSRNGLDLY